MSWDHAVSWGWGFGLALAILVGLAVMYKPIILNSGPHSAQTLQQLLLLLLLALRQSGIRDAHKISPHGTMTKRVMNWDHAVSWGWGVWVSVSDIGRVGSGWPRQNRARDAHKISPHGTMTKRRSYELGPRGQLG